MDSLILLGDERMLDPRRAASFGSAQSLGWVQSLPKAWQASCVPLQRGLGEGGHRWSGQPAGTAELFPGVLHAPSQEQPGLGLGVNEVLLVHIC